jgi:mannose-1-phosphate guanylyltransferase
MIPCDVGWSDLGSWATVYECLAKRAGENVATGRLLALDARGNLLLAPGKLVAAVGVENLVLVETDDALLICRRERSQDVSQVVKLLEEKKLRRYL